MAKCQEDVIRIPSSDSRRLLGGGGSSDSPQSGLLPVGRVIGFLRRPESPDFVKSHLFHSTAVPLLHAPLENLFAVVEKLSSSCQASKDGPAPPSADRHCQILSRLLFSTNEILVLISAALPAALQRPMQ